ncbi:MAG: hypothetical protein M1379_02535 [Firmicutes bacterium]|nr:hypothetical protein [Bacillota bacterium]
MESHIPFLLNHSFDARIKAEKEEKQNQKIELLLNYYKVMYEGLLPTLLAPIIISIGTSQNPKKKKPYKLDRDGRVKLSLIDNIAQHINNYPIPVKQIKIGLNPHLRNSYAHERFQILDDGKVKLWDVDPNTKAISWGPYIWDIEKLMAICNELWNNALAIFYSLIIFSANNRGVLIKGGYFEKIDRTIQPYQLTREDIENIAGDAAYEMHFELKSFQYADSLIFLEIRTMHKGIDQESTIYVNNGDLVEKYTSEIKYIVFPDLFRGVPGRGRRGQYAVLGLSLSLRMGINMNIRMSLVRF